MNYILHTKSDYGIEQIHLDFKPNARAKGNLDFLKKREEELYRRFGSRNFDDFLAEVRSLFLEKGSKDREVIGRFAPSRLDRSIRDFTTKNSGIYEPEVKFVFDFSQVNNNLISKELKKSMTLKNKDLLINPIIDEQIFHFGVDDRELKKYIEKTFSYHKYRSEKNWNKYLHSFVKDLVSAKVLTAYGKDDAGEFTVPLSFASIPNFPWGVMKEDIERAKLTGDITLITELEKALDSIHYFIFNILGEGASPILLKAMNQVWDKNFKIGKKNPVLFFHGTKTENFVSAVQGALGEFQAAVIFTYIGFKTNNQTIARLIGDTYKNKEPLRTDVEIFNKIGVQVKNFNSFLENDDLTFLKDRGIDSKMHPKTFSKYLGKDGIPFLNFIANYYFNTNYQEKVSDSFKDMIEELGTYLGELMNLSMGTELSDTFCFYLVSGKYLIPASRILEMAKDINLANSIEIKCADIGMSDEEFASFEKNTTHPEFTKYWRKRTHGWTPTRKNIVLYQDLVSSKISMQTKFHLIKKIEKYAIF